MTPEQIERLRNLVNVLATGHAVIEVDEGPALRALLGEWEERGREIERLKNEIAWQEERNANNVRAYTEEVERLKADLVFKQIDYDAFARMKLRAEAAEARLARVVEQVSEAHRLYNNIDAEGSVEKCLRAALAAAQSGDER